MSLKGFSCKVSASNVMWAEMWGMFSGLKLVKDLGFSKVIIEMES